LVATFLGRVLGFYNPDEPAGFIGSLIGAIIELLIYHFIRRNRVGGA
jgi:uncharacterized membrane protein YeaQ/YmgE (transglycosylase-associated protein family)